MSSSIKELTCSFCILTVILQGCLSKSITFESCEKPCEYYATNKTVDCTNRMCSSVPYIPAAISPDIEELRLQRNHITKVPALTFNSLKRLYLQNNYISQIEDKAFEECLLLEHLDLSNNRLTNATYSQFSGLNHLLTLDLGSNSLTMLETALFTFTNMKHLKYLSFRNNLIKKINSEAFTDLEKLATVDLSRNKITEVNIRDFDGLGELHELRLQNNKIKKIEDATFVPLVKLEKLILSHNSISDIENGAFSAKTPIKELDLSHNFLDAIPISLGLLKNLTILNMDENPVMFVKFDKPFSHLGKTLKNLSLSNMPKLEEIPEGAFTQLSVLCDIQMHDNPLYEIHPKAFNNTQKTIKTANLSHNQLKTLNGSMLNWEYIHDLDLSDNPWQCDCNLEWVLEKAMPRTHWNNTICHSPPELKGQPVKSIQWDQFVCPTSTKQFAYHHSGAPALVVIIPIAFVILALGITLFAYYNRKRICHNDKKPKYVSLYNAKDPAEDARVTVAYNDPDTEKTVLKKAVHV